MRRCLTVALVLSLGCMALPQAAPPGWSVVNCAPIASTDYSPKPSGEGNVLQFSSNSEATFTITVTDQDTFGRTVNGVYETKTLNSMAWSMSPVTVRSGAVYGCVMSAYKDGKTTYTVRVKFNEVSSQTTFNDVYRFTDPRGGLEHESIADVQIQVVLNP